MKRISGLDIIFLIFASIFSLVCIYEGVHLLAPFYSFGKVLICFSGLSFLYGYMKYSQENRYMLAYLKYFKDHISSLVSIGCIVIMGALIFLGISGKTALMPWFFGGGCIFFIFAKIHGFRFDYSLIQSSPDNKNTWKIFILSIALFIMALATLFKIFALPFDTQKYYYLLGVSIYSITGISIFFQWNIPPLKEIFFLRKLSVYHFLSVILIGSLGVILYFTLGTQSIPENKVVETVISPPVSEPIINTPVLPEEKILAAQKVSQVYSIAVGLKVGSKGLSVTHLQTVLQKLSYFTGSISGNFDENTRLALKQALISECGWPKTTQGIFGTQAKACIDSLELVFP